MPPLFGYVSTTAKPSSQVLLSTPQVDPLLVEWQYGLGRVVVWTSDAKNRWAQDWVGWSEFGRFWAAAVKRTIPSPIDRNNQVTVTPDSRGVRITVDSISDDRAYVNFMKTQATLVTPEQQEQQLELPQVAPGRYEASAPASVEGPYFLNITQQGPDGQTVVGRPAGFVVSYSPEYRALDPNQDLRTQLARLTGGRQLADPLATFDRSLQAGGSPREIWPLLVALAAMVFLLDVAVRRLRLAMLDLRQAGATIGARVVGRAQAVAAPAQARLLAAKDRIVVETPSLSGRATTSTRAGRGPGQAAANQPTTSAALSSRLLEAKRRAGPKGE
jgi:hypothetical protein